MQNYKINDNSVYVYQEFHYFCRKERLRMLSLRPYYIFAIEMGLPS